MSLLYLSQILIGLTIISLFLGRKIIRSTKRSVSIKDERLETVTSKKTISDQLVFLAGATMGAGVAYAITGSLFFTFIGLGGGFAILKWRKKKVERERLQLLHEQLPEVMTQFGNATKGGLNPYQAIEDVVPNLPRPSRDIFYEVLGDVRNGRTLSESIDIAIDKTKWYGLKDLSLSFKLYDEIGVDVEKICNHTYENYYEQENLKGQTDAAIASTISSMKILSALPFVVVGAMRTMSPSFAEPLFHTLVGVIFFLGCVLLIITGNFLVRRKVTKTLGG